MITHKKFRGDQCQGSLLGTTRMDGCCFSEAVDDLNKIVYARKPWTQLLLAILSTVGTVPMPPSLLPDFVQGTQWLNFKGPYRLEEICKFNLVNCLRAQGFTPTLRGGKQGSVKVICLFTAMPHIIPALTTVAVVAPAEVY